MASILPGWNLAGRNAPGFQTRPFETTDLRQIQGLSSLPPPRFLSLLPLWEKVARTKSVPDEGVLCAERDPSPVFASRSHPLPQGERELRNSRRRVREAVGLELVAQRGFQDLSGRGVRNAVDEHDVVRHPPFGDLAIHVFQDVLAGGALTLLELHDQ